MERENRVLVREAAATIADLDNNALIIRLLFTVNHLSRWLTPIHDQIRLGRPTRRDQPSVKQLLVRFRDEERRTLPKLHAITTRASPDLDKLPPLHRTPAEERLDDAASTIEVLAEFRRLRQSTGSLLRSLPDEAWHRVGISRREHDWTPRSLGAHLLLRDLETLAELDHVLDASGLRQNVTAASRVHLADLLPLGPTSIR